jgi:hypothetical protein
MKFKIGQFVQWGDAIGIIVEISNLKKKTYKVDFGYLVEITENQLKEYE